MEPTFRNSLFSYWYLLIGAGFTLLGINRWILGDHSWTVYLRFCIAVGFFVLGIITRR